MSVELPARSSVPQAGSVLGRAFTTDPVFRWLMEGRPELQRRLTTVFGAFAAAASRKPDGTVLVSECTRASAIWLPPGQWRTPFGELLRQGPPLIRAFGPRTVRALNLLSVVEKQHPEEPHWYLEAIGTVPEARGQGIGPQVLTPVLDRCDAERLPAYLESSNPQNIPFYERHGFVRRPLLQLPAGCPVITPMWREPH